MRVKRPRPVRWLRRIGLPHTWVDRFGEYDLRYEACLVTRGYDYMKPLLLRAGARFVVGSGCMLLMGSLPDTHPLDSLAYLVVSLIVGGWAGYAFRRPGSYRNGWIDGRERFVAQMQEHYNRGSSAEDWLRTEGDHDMVHVLGLPPLPPRYQGPVEWDT